MKKFVKVLLIVLLSVFSQTGMVKAATGKIAVYYSDSKPTVGTSITLRITASCANGVGVGKVYIEYNESYFSLSKTSAGGNYNSGSHMLMIESEGEKSVSYTFVFTCKKVGNTSIIVHTLEFIDYENGNDVTGYSEDIDIDFSIQTKTNNNPGTTTLSGDNTLSSLSVENFKFEEEFSSDKYEYTLYVPSDTERLDITAKTSSGKAKIKDFSTALVEGWNRIEVVCVAENKEERKYTINVYVEESPKVFYDFEGKKLGAVVFLEKTEKFGFEKEEINGNTVFKNKGYELIYLIDEDGNRDFYQYDSINNRIIDLYRTIEINNREYVITKVNYDEFTELNNEDFVQNRIKINDQELDGWKYVEEYKRDLSVIYLKKEDGTGCLYQYDVKEGTLQRFIYEYQPPQVIVEKNPVYPIMVAISAGLLILSLLYVIRTNIKIRKMRIISK